MRIKSKFISCLALLSALVAMPAQAHHSFAMFDEGQCLSISGSVRKLQWGYPHMWLWVVKGGADGAPEVWGFEGGDPATLARMGWKGDLLKKGDKVTVFFNPLRDGRKGGSLRQVILPGGKKVGAQVGGAVDEKYFKSCGASR